MRFGKTGSAIGLSVAALFLVQSGWAEGNVAQSASIPSLSEDPTTAAAPVPSVSPSVMPSNAAQSGQMPGSMPSSAPAQAAADNNTQAAPAADTAAVVEAQQSSGEDMTAEQASPADFLAENAKNEGVMQTASGLQYKVLVAGNGAKPAETDSVTVQYEGRLVDGTVFDSSYKRGQAAQFRLNQVIQGWTEGLQLMQEGATWELYIPSTLAYGVNGIPGVIPPNSTLIFKVELVKVAK